MEEDDKKKWSRREIVGAAVVGAAATILPQRGHGQFVPFAFPFVFVKNSNTGLLTSIPGTVEAHGSPNSNANSYYLLIDNSNNRIIFTTGDRVNSSSQLYTLPRYLQSGSSITVSFSRSSSSATIYAVGGGGGGGGSFTYNCGWGGSSGRILIATTSIVSNESVTLDCGKKTPPVTGAAVANASPYWSRVYFSSSKMIQSGGGCSHDYTTAPAPLSAIAGVTVVTDTYNVSYTGYGYCNDNYYYSQSGTSGSGYSFMGTSFGSPGTYRQNNNGIDGFACINLG